MHKNSLNLSIQRIFIGFSFVKPSQNAMQNLNQKRYQQYIIAQLDSDDGSDEDEDMNIETLPRITASETLNLVKWLRLYEEQQDQERSESNSTA
ncbi:uncharacterized protein PADG_11954 [Paracoccidioides brasiliensis Pb18]|uniref:Uncharacterized protein n=1 Tax=Paracoccidioides brasiliensis (strain Pb18) TaxID=502780 RepID=A0A0A0HRY1_PARBD|nr:uncharacterized protein PADG_11954 [Paracoccidioides brasiliensis Pb18]KGM91974.1 hypothetical protein PADG_11954 [Paracoccidioides brasiliensis Pb18]